MAMNVPQIDFRPLGQLYDTYRQNRLEGVREGAMAGFDGDMNSLGSLGQKLLRAGDYQGGLSFMKMAQDYADKNSPSYDFMEVGDSLVRTDNRGGYEVIPGVNAVSDMDRRYKESQINANNARAARARPLPTAAVNSLTEAGAAVTDYDRFTNTFQDDFAGAYSGAVGDFQNWLGRNVPGSSNAAQAQWWQDYQNRKNLMRNQLFGSALTATEAREFDKANINPGMTPEAIRANVQRQEEAALRAARKLAKVYAAQGYSREAIEAAIGITIPDAPQVEAQEPAALPADIPAGTELDGYIFLGGDPAEQTNWAPLE